MRTFKLKVDPKGRLWFIWFNGRFTNNVGYFIEDGIWTESLIPAGSESWKIVECAPIVDAQAAVKAPEPSFEDRMTIRLGKAIIASMDEAVFNAELDKWVEEENRDSRPFVQAWQERKAPKAKKTRIRKIRPGSRSRR